jgi:large subunit ribosomal protein L25
MEAQGHGSTLGTSAAEKREATRQERGAPAARRGPDPGRALRRRVGEPKAAIAVDPKALMRILHSESGVNTLIGLRSTAATTRVMVKEYQLDPVTHQLLHADFYRSRWTRRSGHRADRAQGRGAGRQAAGRHARLRAPRDRVECLPGDIPEHITVDVSELMLNQGVRVRDLPTEAEVDAGERPRHDDRARRGAARSRRPATAEAARRHGRARGDQEGQDRDE